MKAPAALVLLMFFSFPLLAQTPAPVQRNEVPLSKCIQLLSDEQLARFGLHFEFRSLAFDIIRQAPSELRPEVYQMVRPALQALLDDDLRLGLPSFDPSTNQTDQSDPIVDCSKLQTIRPLNSKDELQIWKSLARRLHQELNNSASVRNQFRSMLKESLERSAQLAEFVRTSPNQSLLAEKQREFAEAARRLDEMRDRWLRDELHVYLQRANQILLRDLLQP